MAKTAISISIDESMAAAVRKIAEKSQVPVSEVVATCINMYLEPAAAILSVAAALATIDEQRLDMQDRIRVISDFIADNTPAVI